MGRERESCSDGTVLDLGLNTSAFGDSDTCGTGGSTSVIVLAALSISVIDRGLAASNASR